MIEAKQIAQEANKTQQFVHNLIGQTFTAEHAERINGHVERVRELIRESNRRFHLRLRAFAAYGGRCACCGESNPDKPQYVSVVGQFAGSMSAH